MKSAEVLKRYAAGERDFRGANLRGQSFKGKDLSGADFSGADIRSANFTRAKLYGANFSEVKAGLQRRWAIVLVLAAWLLEGMVGLFSALPGALVLIMFDSQLTGVISGWTALIVIVVLLIVMSRTGASAGAGVGAIAVASAGVFASAVAIAGADVFIGAFVIAGAIAGAITFALAGAFTFTLAVAGTVAGTVASVVAVALASAGTGAGALLVAFAGTVTGSTFTVALAVTVTFAGTIILVSAYLTWRALEGDPRYTQIRAIAIVFAAIGGTRFRNARLSHATFIQATLKNTDFRRATLTLTNWHQSKQLDLARLGGTLLLDPKVRALAVTHCGASQSYKGFELQGLYLAGADLSNADLTEADISNATLECADLAHANLIKTQALGTNFKQTRLTGACLEKWHIGSTTQLEGAICEYVYLVNRQRERQPSSGNFAPGEFAKLFEEVLSNINLIFRDGLDWRAFIASFNQTQLENEETDLSIQRIENKGGGVVVVGLNAPPNADKEKIHSDFNRYYEAGLKASDDKYQVQLQAQEEKIALYRQQSADMKEIVCLLASRPLNFESEYTIDRATKRILILTANPTNSERLNLDEEVREIKEGIRRSRCRKLFSIASECAVRTKDFYRHMLDIQPQIVHFCGHGLKKEGIVLQDNVGRMQLLGGDAIASMFEPFASKGLQCVLLNACYSESQAEGIAQHIPYVIGMPTSIDNKTAITFAVAFYDALGAGGNIESAFKFGCSQLGNLKEPEKPVLTKQEDCGA